MKTFLLTLLGCFVLVFISAQDNLPPNVSSTQQIDLGGDNSLFVGVVQRLEKCFFYQGTLCCGEHSDFLASPAIGWSENARNSTIEKLLPALGYDPSKLNRANGYLMKDVFKDLHTRAGIPFYPFQDAGMNTSYHDIVDPITPPKVFRLKAPPCDCYKIEIYQYVMSYFLNFTDPPTSAFEWEWESWNLNLDIRLDSFFIKKTLIPWNCSEKPECRVPCCFMGECRMDMDSVCCIRSTFNYADKVTGHGVVMDPCVPEICKKQVIPAATTPSSGKIPGEQSSIIPLPEDWIEKIVGSGNTTGLIATITANNPTDEAVLVSIGPAVIPGLFLFQPYLLPDILIFLLPPHQSVDLPVREGYCLDIHKLPVPDNEPFQPLATWKPVTSTVPDLPPTVYSMEPLRPGPPEDPDVLEITYPGSKALLTSPMDDLATLAPIVHQVVQQTRDAYDRLKESGKILTPFSSTPEREREAVVQQVLWMYTSRLDGDPYEQSDLMDRIESQYLHATGQTTVSEPDKIQLQAGGQQFWGIFTLVGLEAKVFTKT